MSNMIKAIKYNKVSGGRIQMMYLRFATNNDNRNNIIGQLVLTVSGFGAEVRWLGYGLGQGILNCLRKVRLG